MSPCMSGSEEYPSSGEFIDCDGWLKPLLPESSAVAPSNGLEALLSYGISG